MSRDVAAELAARIRARVLFARRWPDAIGFNLTLAWLLHNEHADAAGVSTLSQSRLAQMLAESRPPSVSTIANYQRRLCELNLLELVSRGGGAHVAQHLVLVPPEQAAAGGVQPKGAAHAG